MCTHSFKNTNLCTSGVLGQDVLSSVATTHNTTVSIRHTVCESWLCTLQSCEGPTRHARRGDHVRCVLQAAADCFSPSSNVSFLSSPVSLLLQTQLPTIWKRYQPRSPGWRSGRKRGHGGGRFLQQTGKRYRKEEGVIEALRDGG